MAISYTLLILAVLWAAFFLWPLVQRRLEGGRRTSIGSLSSSFTRSGSFTTGNGLAARISSTRRIRPIATRPLPGPPARSASFGDDTRPQGLPMSSEAQRRRRDALVILGGGVLATLLLAVVSASTVAWAVHALVDFAFAAYIVALVQIRRRADERRATVHFLPQPVARPTLVLRRTASS